MNEASEIRVKQPEDLLALVIRERNYQSKTKGRTLIKSGFVQVNGKTCRVPSTSLEPGDQVLLLPYERQERTVVERPFPFEVIHENAEIIAFVKPAGMPTLADRPQGKSVQKLLRAWLDRHDPDADLYPVNRIDPPVSGIVVACKDVRDRTDFEAALQEAQVRMYALVEGRVQPADGTWNRDLRPLKEGLLGVGKPTADSRRSVVHYRTMHSNGTYSLLKLTPDTRLRHQERALCAAAGNPVCGDRKYRSSTNPLHRMGLHVFSIEFESPNGGVVSLKTPVPRLFLRSAKFE